MRAPELDAGGHGRRLVLFGGVGVFNTATDFIVFAGLVALGVFPVGANVAAFLVANAQSYWMNARVTFRNGEVPAATSLGAYGKFLSAHLVSLLISTGMIAAFANLIGAVGAKAVAAIFTLAWNYMMSAHFVFRAEAPQKGKSQ
jgi:putative flippase GtrA